MLHACGCESLADAWREDRHEDGPRADRHRGSAADPAPFAPPPFTTAAPAPVRRAARGDAVAHHPRLFDHLGRSASKTLARRANRHRRRRAALPPHSVCDPLPPALRGALRGDSRRRCSRRRERPRCRCGGGRPRRRWRGAAARGTTRGRPRRRRGGRPPSKRQRDDPSDAAEADVAAAEPAVRRWHHDLDGRAGGGRHIWREVCERQGLLARGQRAPAPERGLIVDVGANIGIFALWWRGASPTQPLCIEPAPPSFALLQRNLRTHDEPRRRTTYRARRRRRPRHAHLLPARPRLVDAPSAGEARAAVRLRAGAPRRPRRGASYTVDVRPLAAALRERGLRDVALLKIDVEHDELRPRRRRRRGRGVGGDRAGGGRDAHDRDARRRARAAGRTLPDGGRARRRRDRGACDRVREALG